MAILASSDSQADKLCKFLMEENSLKFDSNKYFINETLTLREYQLKLLEILQYFDQFCRSHGLIYYLCGGTCLGAVRHKGFIPWDCDIDVFMHRKDYDALEDLWGKYADTDHYAYDRTTKTNNMHQQCAGIKNNLTTYIRDHNVNFNMNHGVQIDIIPLDALSDRQFQYQLQKFNAALFCLFNAQRIPNQSGKAIQFLSKAMLSVFRSQKRRYKIWKNAEKRFSKYDVVQCKYLGELITGFHNINLRFPKEWFETPIEMEFEGGSFYGPTEPEKYLETRYPEFMNYPPKSEQLPKFSPAFIDIHTPYKQYKGIKYCITNTEED